MQLRDSIENLMTGRCQFATIAVVWPPSSLQPQVTNPSSQAHITAAAMHGHRAGAAVLCGL